MDPASIAGLLKEHGPYGAIAGLLVAFAWALRGWQTCAEARVKDAEKTGSALERAGATMAAVAAALESRTGHFERLGSKVDAGQTDVKLVLAKLEELDRNIDEVRRGARP